MISQNVGAGLPFWLPKKVQQLDVEVERYIVDKEIECGYEHVYTYLLRMLTVWVNFRPLGSLSRQYVPTNGF